ncbi:MAG: tryptophan-rich sensory protein [Ectothiorhodospiraceae bacterium]|nr:tryptophan-rich sensory protein [Ectothiorhodospiraceae bacterium]MCH8505724.1 tryptophan-rich sensory protein [Ectothiorhodospiraceae bacterium]
MTSRYRSLPALAGWLLLCFAVAAFGAQFSPGDWYASLQKPPWTPPNWVFAPAWTLLYGLMAVAAWLVWRRRRQHGARAALVAFLVQLLFNAAWSWLFFGMNAVGVAMLDILLLILAITMTMGLFFHVSRTAGWLMLPYLLWVLYASSLNAAIWVMN